MKKYHLQKAKRRLHDDGHKINGATPYQAKYDEVIALYLKVYTDEPPEEPARGSKKSIRSKKVKKNLTEKDKWWINYKKVIHSDKWKLFRNNIMKKFSHTCQKCFRKFKPGFLHVHHLHYKTLGNEKEDDVLLLCQDCHHEEHVRINRERKIKKLT